MIPEGETLSSLSNPLATVEQLSNSSSSLDGVPPSLESSVRFAGLQITQAAGILLRMPQEIIAQAMVIFTRFYLGPEGGSVRKNGAKDVSAASIYIAAKLSADPRTTRSVCNVYAYLMSAPTRQAFPDPPPNDPESYFLSEGSYHSARALLLQTETIILRTLSFNTKVVVPHHLALTYLQTLGVLSTVPSSTSRNLASRTLGYLNLALFSPQLLYITHQPTSLAVAAIYLTAREVEVKLPSNEWWEVFDVDREELGFLVVALQSCEGWIRAEKERWPGKSCPVTVDEVNLEIKDVV
ncbi:MAG: hypothetical protein L6R36_006292 [Xanthoria steineri]|nr:MAG: hypothetical protein L6R36_006292 [Xanthoria steineri]